MGTQSHILGERSRRVTYAINMRLVETEEEQNRETDTTIVCVDFKS
jgi:hypothetical protein